MIPEDLVTTETVELYVKNASKRGHTYNHPDWKKDMWNMSYNDIIRYLADRMEKTKLQEEYYGILPYLVGHVDEKTLFRPYSKRAKKVKVQESTLKPACADPASLPQKSRWVIVAGYFTDIDFYKPH